MCSVIKDQRVIDSLVVAQEMADFLEVLNCPKAKEIVTKWKLLKSQCPVQKDEIPPKPKKIERQENSRNIFDDLEPHKIGIPTPPGRIKVPSDGDFFGTSHPESIPSHFGTHIDKIPSKLDYWGELTPELIEKLKKNPYINLTVPYETNVEKNLEVRENELDGWRSSFSDAGSSILLKRQDKCPCDPQDCGTTCCKESCECEDKLPGE